MTHRKISFNEKIFIFFSSDQCSVQYHSYVTEESPVELRAPSRLIGELFFELKIHPEAWNIIFFRLGNLQKGEDVGGEWDREPFPPRARLSISGFRWSVEESTRNPFVSGRTGPEREIIQTHKRVGRRVYVAFVWEKKTGGPL